MDFRLNAEQQQLRETARRFAQAELPQLARALEESASPVPQSMLSRYAEMGFLGINLPEADGGHGMSHLDAVIVLEELAKISPTVAFPIFESCFGPILAIAHFAPAALRKRLIPRVVAGELIVAVSMSEPDAGSAATDLKSRAIPNANGWTLKTTPMWPRSINTSTPLR